MTTFTAQDLAQRLRDNSDLGIVGNADDPHGSETRRINQPTPAQPSPLEAKFMQAWRAMGGPELEAEYRFDLTRRWRFDFAHVDSRVAVEIDGGTHSQGRHTRHEGFRGDCEKKNAATLQGWRVFTLTSDMIDVDHILPIISTIQEDAWAD